MKILYLHQFFKTPEDPGGTRSYWIARELIKSGHEVIMLTSNKKIAGKKEVRMIDGIKVIYLNVIYDSGKMSILERYWAFFRFTYKVVPEAWKINDIDLVVATSTPLTIGIPAVVLKIFKRIPFIFEVRDLWPEVPIQMGALKNPVLRKTALLLEQVIYRNAAHMVALSPGMKQGMVDKGVAEEKITMIPNMSKIDEFWSRPKDVNLVNKIGLHPDSFKVIYFGAMNIANGIDYIIDAAKLLSLDKKAPHIEFLFVGAGASKERAMERCREEHISNVTFLNKVPMKKLSKIVNFCDVSLVTFQNIPILRTNSPNKLFDALSAGKPLIVNSSGWTKDLVEDHQCGIFTDPENPKELKDAISYLSLNPEVVTAMGEQARKLAETTYDKEILCRQFAALVNRIPGNSHSVSKDRMAADPLNINDLPKEISD